jgi:arylsulfatase
MTLTEDMLRELTPSTGSHDFSKDPTETTIWPHQTARKLIEMIALWYMEAGNNAPPDSRGTLRFADERPQLTRTQDLRSIIRTRR